MPAKAGVLITGSGGGIGHALCNTFRKHGYWTIGTDLPDKGTSSLVDAFVGADLALLCSDAEYRRDVESRVLDALGDRRLFALVNNAASQVARPIAELTVFDWQTTLSVNLIAPFLLSQLFLERLAASGGSIVNVTSIHATLTKANFSAYATSKAALTALTRSMAIELGARVRINAVAPAAVETEMLRSGFAKDKDKLEALRRYHPTGRIAHPEEIAEAVLFLSSTTAKFINGAVLQIDGGIGARLHDPA